MKLSFFGGRWGIRILVFLLLGLALWAFRAQNARRSGEAPLGKMAPPPSVSLGQMHTDWQKMVRDTAARYEQDHDAARARDSLLALTVAPADQATHLQLVLALNALAEGASDAGTKWKAALQAFGQQLGS